MGRSVFGPLEWHTRLLDVVLFGCFDKDGCRFVLLDNARYTPMTTQTTLNWYFDEDARLREEMLLARLAQSRHRWTSRGRLRLTRLFVVLALALVVFGLGREYWVWQEERMRTVIARSVGMEAWAWHQLDYEAVTAALDPEARDEWVRWYNLYQQGRRTWAGRDARLPTVRVGQVDFLGGGEALVEVRILAPEVPDVEEYRQRYIYRNVAGEWLRSSTDVTLWGAVTEAQSGIFHFTYSTRDAEAVEQVIPQVETIWANLHARLALPENPAESDLRIVVQGDNVGISPLRFDGDRLVLISPKLLRAPVYEDEAQTLSGQIATALTRKAMDQFMQGRGFDPRWSITYEAALKWLAEDANPLLPREPKQESGALRKYVAQTGLPRLNDLLEKREADYFWFTGWASTAAHSLVTYALNVHGRDKIDDLIVGLTHAADWEALTQSVFGVSASDFEAGWHRYLRQRYELK